MISFYPPKIPIGGGTSLGLALDVLMEEIDTKVIKTTLEQRGDWEPVVFLITDGKPTDNPISSVKRWASDYASRASMVAITLGMNSDMNILRQLTSNVLALENNNEEDFKKFIDWVSASVRAQSQKIETEGKSSGVSLEKAGDSGLTIIDETDGFSNADPDYVVLTGRCTKTKKPYLMKYSKIKVEGLDNVIKNEHFGLEGAFALDETYFDWSSISVNEESVNTSVLEGVPPCPSCGNPTAFAICKCKKLICLDETGIVTCPWCNEDLHFDMSSGGDAGERGFNVTRGQG